MIRLGFMTDEFRVIGALEDADSAARFATLPAALRAVMGNMYQADNIVVGARSLGPWRLAEDRNVFVMSGDPDFDAAADHVQVVCDHQVLVERFELSQDELLVVGGLSMFRLFLPYASQMEVAISDVPLCGDLVFEDWDRQFRIENVQNWKGGRTLHCVAQVPGEFEP